MREIVAASRGVGVGSVRGGLVVDGGLVHGVVCNGDEGGEEHGRDPGDAVGGAERGPGEVEEADCFEGTRKRSHQRRILGERATPAQRRVRKWWMEGRYER
jgi:hypothetical protein